MSVSESLFQQACQLIPGGVNSPVRAFHAVGGSPIFMVRGEGAYLYSADDKRYIDFIGSWGPLILGHAHPAVIDAVQAAVAKGLGFGASTPLEVQHAEKALSFLPHCEKIRMVNSGTEATLTALRLARAYSQRNKVIKFAGGYHGHHDALLAKAGSGLLTLGIPNTPGIPESVTQDTLIADYNDLSSVETLFQNFGKDIAAVIVEPVAGNMNCIPPQAGFLAGLKTVCEQYGSVLIFDEVMTGFRVAPGGASERYGVTPHLTTLGKIIGGGLPVGAIAGPNDIMSLLAPVGPVYQAGTLSGNPIAMTAGLATLEQLTPELYAQLENNTAYFLKALEALAHDSGIAIHTQQVGSMFGIFFTEMSEITNFTAMSNCNTQAYNDFFQAMLKQGVYFAPSAFEAGFASIAHDRAVMDEVLNAAREVFKHWPDSH